MSEQQLAELVKAIYFVAGAIVVHAIAGGPSVSGIQSAIRDVAKAIEKRGDGR
jgi:hypothetical protein